MEIKAILRGHSLRHELSLLPIIALTFKEYFAIHWYLKIVYQKSRKFKR